MSEIDSEAWVDAALHALARGGVAEVRVEVLAQDLGVTKGGFYRRFRDRRALLEAALDAWAEGRLAVIADQLTLEKEPPAQRLQAVIRLFAERANAEGFAIELAIRQWARRDPAAAAAVEKVDAARLAAARRMYAALGFAPAEAEARAMLFYAYVFGQGLLFLDLPAQRRAALITACSNLLTEGA